MEEKVPITFSYNGKEYRGKFDPVFGAGRNVWYLMINKYYSERLRLNDNGWFFDGNKFTELADDLGDYLTSWYQ